MADSRNRERGLRAALHNPRVSEEAKQHDRELLASEFGEHVDEPQSQSHTGKRRSSATTGTKKSASTGPHSHSAGAGQAAAAAGVSQEGSSTTGAEKPQASVRKTRRASSGDAGALQAGKGEEKDKGNVIRGLKAALKNPHVSEKAKEADRKKLMELGETVE